MYQSSADILADTKIYRIWPIQRRPWLLTHFSQPAQIRRMIAEQNRGRESTAVAEHESNSLSFFQLSSRGKKHKEEEESPLLISVYIRSCAYHSRVVSLQICNKSLSSFTIHRQKQTDLPCRYTGRYVNVSKFSRSVSKPCFFHIFSGTDSDVAV